jgi:preprotein translocase subunit SecF
MIDFLKYRYFFYALSFGLLAVGGVAFFAKGFNYSVDFTGGSELRLSFEKQIEIGALRNALASKGWKDATIQSIGATGKSFLVQVGSSDKENIGDKIVQEIKAAFPDNQLTLDSIDWVGPEVGRDIKVNALVSLILSLLVLLLYISIRSKYRFAVGAIASLMHDLLVILTYFLVFQEQVSIHFLAAVLTVLGYSINDTIVIFSRIKENLVKMKGVAEEEIVNVSINQTLRRTILTSFATLLTVAAIFIFGGESLRVFSLTMLIGIFVGTYSSIYIASPVMLAFGSSKDDEKK